MYKVWNENLGGTNSVLQIYNYDSTTEPPTTTRVDKKEKQWKIKPIGKGIL
jgi:hypothetical protein